MTSLEAVRARFARNQGLPFADVLTEASIRAVLDEHGVQFRDRLFNPFTTIWGFLSQVLRATGQNHWRRVGPQRAGQFGLRAHVDVTEIGSV